MFSLENCRVLASIVILGKACDLIDHHHELKKAGNTATMSSPTPNKKKPQTSSTNTNTSDLDTDIAPTSNRSATTTASIQPKGIKAITLFYFVFQ